MTLSIRCKCGHHIHQDEVDPTILVDPEEDVYAVRFRCSMCCKHMQYAFKLKMIGMAKWTTREDVWQKLCDKFFLHDAENPRELVSIEKTEPITMSEYNDFRVELYSEPNIIAKLKSVWK